MARYFFHVVDDVVAADDEGMEFADAASARLHAVKCARELMCDQLRQGRLHLGHRIEIEDSVGAPVMRVHFAEVVAIRD